MAGLVKWRRAADVARRWEGVVLHRAEWRHDGGCGENFPGVFERERRAALSCKRSRRIHLGTKSLYGRGRRTTISRERRRGRRLSNSHRRQLGGGAAET